MCFRNSVQLDLPCFKCHCKFFSIFLVDTYSHRLYPSQLMNNLQAQITIRLVAAMLVAMAVIGLSAIAMHAPTQKPNSLTRSLKNIQTDNATLFYADQRMDRGWCVEMVLPGTSESKAATDNLKLIAATL
jgi:hypothetical protein